MKFRYHFVFLTLLLLPYRSLHAQLLEKKVLSLEAAEKVASAAALEAKKRNAQWSSSLSMMAVIRSC